MNKIRPIKRYKMKHPLEIENENLQKHIEDAYNEITQTEMEIFRYYIHEITESMFVGNDK